MSSNIYTGIRSRMIAIIKKVSNEDRRFKSMEEATHISGATWRTFWNRDSAPSGEMIEAVSERWPQYAFWLATGGTDPIAGHVAPSDAECVLEKINEEVPEATEYFKYQMELLSRVRARRRATLEKIGVPADLHMWAGLMNPDLQIEIEKRMPPGSNLFVQTSEKRTFSTEYEQAREQFMQELHEQKLKKLDELRKRKNQAASIR